MGSPLDLSGLEEGNNHSLDAGVTDTDKPTNTHMIIAEFVGTYILVFAGCGSIIINALHDITIVGIGVVWGMVVMAMIYTLGHISGAHFNPAITIAFGVSHKFPWRHVPMYIVAQVLGATLATMTLHVLYKSVDINTIVNGYSDPTTDLEAVIWEFIITFILMFTICGVATDHRAINELSGVAVGAALLLNVIIAGPVTGASMNPARSIGPAMVAGNYKNVWVYIVGPTLGAIFATVVYALIRVPVSEKTENTGKVV